MTFFVSVSTSVIIIYQKRDFFFFSYLTKMASTVNINGQRGKIHYVIVRF